MKTIVIITVVLLGQLVFASGTTIGNGGNSVVCKNASGAISSVEILDFYEVRLNGKSLKLNSQLSDYKDILVENLKRWRDVAPYRVAQYLKWLSEFESETLFASGEIPVIPDTGSVILPKGCELKPIAFQRREAELFPGVKRYTINQDLWGFLDEVQKAGLVMHELIYREGIRVGHKTSFPTRYFNGYLATAEPKVETYASIINQLPLEWTEYGGMLLGIFNRTSECAGSLIEENGNLDACITAIYGPVVTDRFSIKGFSLTYPGKDRKIRIVFDGLNFMLDSRYAPWMAEELKVANDHYNLDFDVSHFKKIKMFSIDIESSMGFPVFQIVCEDCVDEFMLKLNNPLRNWLITKSSQRISSIHAIKFERRYGTEIVTTTNERWIWDTKLRDYVKGH